MQIVIEGAIGGGGAQTVAKIYKCREMKYAGAFASSEIADRLLRCGGDPIRCCAVTA